MYWAKCGTITLLHIVFLCCLPTSGYGASEYPVDGNTRGLWHFNCNYEDETGNYPGLPAGGATFSKDIVRFGACAVDLRSEGARVLFDNSLFDLSEGTVEAWFYPTSGQVDPSTGNSGVFFDKSTIAGTGNGGLRISFNYPDQFVRVEVDWVSGEDVIFSCAIPLHEWTHIAVSWDGSHLNLYKNCQLVGEPIPFSRVPFGTHQGTAFGAAQDGGDDFDGYMDECRVSNVARQETEFTQCDEPTPVRVGTWGSAKALYK